jgi:hypothetical protein
VLGHGAVFFFIITSTLPALFSSVYGIIIEPKVELRLSGCAAAPASVVNLTEKSVLLLAAVHCALFVCGTESPKYVLELSPPKYGLATTNLEPRDSPYPTLLCIVQPYRLFCEIRVSMPR